MGYSAAETAEKHKLILNEANRLFRERGFSAVSVSEVMKAAGLTHGPFYNHFASKEALIAESLTYGLEHSMRHVEALPDTDAGKAQYIEWYLCAAHRDSPGKGCPMAALAAEIRQEPQARGPFTAHLKTLFEKLTTRFRWRTKRSARGDAIRMTSALVGAIILARAVDDEELSQEILDEVKKGFA